jgi:SH3-like domain-containing protein
MKSVRLAAALLLSVVALTHADPPEVAYRTGGPEWAKTWKVFYDVVDHEPEISTPLVKAGPQMVPAILEAIAHKDMKRRRYAISALGNLKDRRALDALTAIVKDESEEDYFRGDAITAIYQIDQDLGTQLAKEYAGQGDNLKMMTEAIITKEPWLTAGPSDQGGPMRTCDATAYVIDPDPKGLNVRSAPRTGKVIGNVPKDKEGTVVRLIAQNGDGGWLQIDNAKTTADKVVFDKKGWVSGNMLAVSTRGYDTKGVKLYEGGEASTVLATIPPETEVRVVGCDGKRLEVKYKNTVGWLNEDDQCPKPSGKCN